MRDGEMRRRNLMHLFEYARSFGESGYRGVYRFVRWLQRMSERGEEPDVGAPDPSHIVETHIEEKKKRTGLYGRKPH